MLNLQRYESVDGDVVETIQDKAHFDAVVDAAIEAEHGSDPADPAANPFLKPPTPTARRRRSRWQVMLGEKVAAFKRGQLDEAKLLRSGRPFVVSICRWYFGDDLDGDDVVQTGTAAFWGAVIDWDPKGAPFDTFARWRVRGALAKLLRGSCQVRGSKQYSGLDDACAVQSDPSASPERQLLQREAVDEVTTALQDIAPELRHIIEAVSLAGQPIEAYAQEVGITVAAARRRVAQGRDALATAVRRRRRGGGPPCNPK